MAEKFPGSWRMVLVLCLVIVAGQILRVVLLQPSMAHLSPEPFPLLEGGQADDAYLVTGPASETFDLIAEHEAAFTPQLDERARVLAAQRGLSTSRVPSARSIVLLLAGKDLLVEPDAMMADLPDGWEVVCGDGGPEYICLVVTSHINYIAEHGGEGR